LLIAIILLPLRAKIGKKMDTQTLIEAVGNIKSKNDKVRFSMLQGIYSVYSLGFSRIRVLTIFEDVPVNIKWVSQVEFTVGGCIFKPKTIGDFISIAASLGQNLNPRFDNEGNSTFLVLWNKGQKVRRD